MGMLTALAWRNLWRQPRRTGLSLFSIAFTAALLVFLLSFQLGGYEQTKESALELLDGYAQIQPLGYADDPDIQRVLAAPAAVRAAIMRIPGVGAAALRINTFAILANGRHSYGAIVFGVEPANEAMVSVVANDTRAGRYLVSTDGAAAVIGDALARNLGASVGTRITLLGSAIDGSVAADVLPVVGIFHTGVPDLDRNLLEMPLARAQATFALGDRVTTIALSAPRLSDIQEALPDLRPIADKHGMVLADWAALEPSLRDTITLKYATSALLYATLVVVVAFIILNTLLMSVLERTHEFGVLLAIGMKPSAIGRMIWLELIAIAVLGSLIGIAVGGAASLWLEQVGIAFPAANDAFAQYGLPTRFFPQLSALSALLGPGAIAAAICLGGIVPYLHVRRLEAVPAMRSA